MSVVEFFYALASGRVAIISAFEFWFAVAPAAAPLLIVPTAVPSTLPVKLPANIVAVESWFAVAPAAAPLLTVFAAVPPIVPVTLPVNVPPSIEDTLVVAASLKPETSLLDIFKPAAVILTAPVLPFTDCTGAAAAAPDAFTKAESLVKLPIVSPPEPDNFILFAVIVPVSIFAPSIVVIALPSSENVPPLKVTTPVNAVCLTIAL